MVDNVGRISPRPGDEGAEPGNRLRDALVIGTDHGTQIRQVELGRERGRAEEIDEHHS